MKLLSCWFAPLFLRIHGSFQHFLLLLSSCCWSGDKGSLIFMFVIWFWKTVQSQTAASFCFSWTSSADWPFRMLQDGSGTSLPGCPRVGEGNTNSIYGGGSFNWLEAPSSNRCQNWNLQDHKLRNLNEIFQQQFPSYRHYISKHILINEQGSLIHDIKTVVSQVKYLPILFMLLLIFDQRMVTAKKEINLEITWFSKYRRMGWSTGFSFAQDFCLLEVCSPFSPMLKLNPNSSELAATVVRDLRNLSNRGTESFLLWGEWLPNIDSCSRKYRSTHQ